MSILARSLFATPVVFATLRPARAAADGVLPANGDLISIGTPAVSPALDYFRLLRVNPASGAVDTIAHLPAGNAPQAITVAPWNGLIYVLGQNSL